MRHMADFWCPAEVLALRSTLEFGAMVIVVSRWVRISAPIDAADIVRMRRSCYCCTHTHTHRGTERHRATQASSTRTHFALKRTTRWPLRVPLQRPENRQSASTTHHKLDDWLAGWLASSQAPSLVAWSLAGARPLPSWVALGRTSHLFARSFVLQLWDANNSNNNIIGPTC